MGLDLGRRTPRGGALDDVRVEGALGQEVETGPAQACGRVLEDLYKDAPDDLSFLLGIFNPPKAFQEALPGVGRDEVLPDDGPHRFDHLFGLPMPQEAVVDED